MSSADWLGRLPEGAANAGILRAISSATRSGGVVLQSKRPVLA
jgi:hypothetical protein